jgi:hypothetical protein
LIDRRLCCAIEAVVTINWARIALNWGANASAAAAAPTGASEFWMAGKYSAMIAPAEDT